MIISVKNKKRNKFSIYGKTITLSKKNAEEFFNIINNDEFNKKAELKQNSEVYDFLVRCLSKKIKYFEMLGIVCCCMTMGLIAMQNFFSINTVLISYATFPIICLGIFGKQIYDVVKINQINSKIRNKITLLEEKERKKINKEKELNLSTKKGNDYSYNPNKQQQECNIVSLNEYKEQYKSKININNDYNSKLNDYQESSIIDFEKCKNNNKKKR